MNGTGEAMNTSRSALRFLVLTVTLTACAREPYILPVADGGAEPSPPSVEGRIAEVRDHDIVVELNEPSGHAPKKFEIRLGKNTDIFTIYGGYVSLSELATGQRVRVWLDRPLPPRPGRASIAAVVILASLDPNDDWP